jgi:hypothetical protein
MRHASATTLVQAVDLVKQHPQQELLQFAAQPLTGVPRDCEEVTEGRCEWAGGTTEELTRSKQ